MATKSKPVPALIAESVTDARDYLATHPHLDPDEVLVVTPKSSAGLRGATVSRFYVTRGMVQNPARVKLAREVRARIAPDDTEESAPELDDAGA